MEIWHGKLDRWFYSQPMTCSELTILAIMPIANGILNTVTLATVIILTVKLGETARAIYRAVEYMESLNRRQ